jgi:hypothetical protein
VTSEEIWKRVVAKAYMLFVWQGHVVFVVPEKTYYYLKNQIQETARVEWKHQWLTGQRFVHLGCGVIFAKREEACVSK